jgi:hypothetical protein
MKSASVVLALLLAALLPSQSFARDFGYEKFADAVRSVYGSGYGVILPFEDIPAAADDPTRRAEGYPGQIWDFAVAAGRTRGTIYQQADVYCPVPGGGPAPIVVGTTQFQNWLYRTEIGVTGDFTVTGANPSDVIFQLSALDAKYVNSYGIQILNVTRSYLPRNDLISATQQAVAACGPHYEYGLVSTLVGDVTITVAFQAGVDTGIMANIGRSIKVNLRLHSLAVRGGTDANPLLIFSEGPKLFAISAAPLPLK